MHEPRTIAEAYLASWNSSPDARPATMKAWSPDATYVDPLMSARGSDEIVVMMNCAVAQFPGANFELTGVPDGHGFHVRFSWRLKGGDGTVMGRGTDVVWLNDDGQILKVVGFLDGVAA